MTTNADKDVRNKMFIHYNYTWSDSNRNKNGSSSKNYNYNYIPAISPLTIYVKESQQYKIRAFNIIIYCCMIHNNKGMNLVVDLHF